MAISYDIEEDYVYNKGIEKGEAIGFEKGFAIGFQKGLALAEQQKEAERKKLVLKMLSSRVLSIEQIAHFLNLPIEHIENIKNSIK